MSFSSILLKDQLLLYLQKQLPKSGVKQSSIGEKLNLGQSAVSTLLNGKSKMSLDQFFIICELIDKNPMEVIAESSSESWKTSTLGKEQGDVLYKSELHIILFCEAFRPITIDEILGDGITYEEAHTILEELVDHGLLKKDLDGKYVQCTSDLLFEPHDIKAALNIRRKVVNRCWELWNKFRDDVAFRAGRHNTYALYSFSDEQIEEIKHDLANLRSKIYSFIFQNQNLNKTKSNIKRKLWCVNLILMNPNKIEK